MFTEVIHRADKRISDWPASYDRGRFIGQDPTLSRNSTKEPKRRHVYFVRFLSLQHLDDVNLTIGTGLKKNNSSLHVDVYRKV
jgi:hypothetical protein